MNVGVICSYPIPYGMAATTRIFSYSKGLREVGDQVDVWSIVPTGFAPHLNTKNSGDFEGVSFFYSYKCRRYSDKFRHALEMLYSLLILGKKLQRRNKTFRYDVLVVSSDNIAILLYVLLSNFFLRCKLVFIFDEYPIPIRHKGKNRIPRWKEIAYKLILRFYSGYVSMTHNLLSFYQKLSFKPGIILSSIIDISRFVGIEKKVVKISPIKLLYMGNMQLSKDNVDNILYAMSILLRDGYDVTLALYGKPNARDKAKLEKIIDGEKISERVCFHFASFDEVPAILASADILVSSQPVTVRAEGGFPTKLGEYLMSGTPALLTDVGETSQYFKDGVHMFFAPPHSPLEFAKKVEFIVDNYDFALKVARQARDYVEREYSHVAAGCKLHDFLQKL